MNQSLFESTWRQLRGHVKGWWRELTDADLDRVGGNFDQFLNLIQAQYGYSRKRAEEEFYRRMIALREVRAQQVAEEFKRRVTKIETRQKL